MIFADTLAEWRRYNETVRELRRLSNRELDDLGIGRDQIGRIARQAARR
jgi:uncharacterized protein YjiS (DUF1127 family)